MMFPRSRRQSRHSSGSSAYLCAALLLVLHQQLLAEKHSNVAPKPIATIPVTPLGFHPPGEIYLLSRLASTSLDFADDTHLLFTFHESRLMSREPDPSHDDQNIRAVVLDTATGHAEATADWRMHDRARYLLPAGNGTFLVRQGNTLSKTDCSLKLHPFLNFDERLLDFSISPDQQLLITESDLERHSPEAHKRLVEEAIRNGESLPDEDVQVGMIRLEDKAVVATARSENPVKLSATSDGYILHEQVDAQQHEQPRPSRDADRTGGDAWRIFFVPFSGEKRTIATLQSTCPPTEDLISEQTLLITNCGNRSADRLGRAVTLNGKELWNGVWDARLAWPTFSRSSGGSVFAICWLRVSHPVDSFDPINDSDVEAQIVQVLSTTTGHLLLSTFASPIFSGGQNFALSPDGKRLAVLNNRNIEIYEVPADTP
jgi:hypothetical protein